MIPSYTRRSLAFGLPGLALQMGWYLFLGDVGTKLAEGSTEEFVWLAGAMIASSVLGSVLLIVGFGYYAKAKGYSAALGLLGMLSCFGLLILALLPDRTKHKTT